MSAILKPLLRKLQPIGSIGRSKQTDPSPEEPIRRGGLPPELWLQVARWMDKADIQRLLTFNRTFYSLAMDAYYNQVSIDTTGDRFEALGELYKLFKRLGKTESNIAERVKTIWASDDILQGFLPHRKRITDRGPYQVFEVGSRHGVLHRIHGIARELKLSLSLTTDAFARCRNVEKLELVLNGPWFMAAKKDTGRIRSMYTSDKHIAQVLEVLCAPFQDNLRELQLTMVNAGHVKRVRRARHFTDELKGFIGHFRKTLRVLKLRYESMGKDPLELLLGQPQSIFLKNLGTGLPIWRANDPTELELPPELSLEQLGIDGPSWRSHGSALNLVLGERSSIHTLESKHYFAVDFFHVFTAMSSGFHRHLTRLTIQTAVFDVRAFIPHIAGELPALQVLEIVCRYFTTLSMPQESSETLQTSSESEPDDSSSDAKDSPLAFALHKIPSFEPIFSRTNLREVDVLRRSKPFGTYYEEQVDCNYCPEVRLWDILHIFARSFPSISVFGANTTRGEVFEYKQDPVLCGVCQERGVWRLGEIA
ncbi:hypothetical protein DL96DRAFT_1579388 [Flagelloscypha sp. PMI_526]|nr:hypothetical protein DL96DRAFT_1579388 [Flagelloscypha sp. PMI_526]